MHPNLIIGCGYLGRRVAQLWQEQGKRVVALTRNRSEELRGLGIEPIIGDVLEPEKWSTKPKAETVLYAVGMDRSSPRSFREVYLDGLRNVLDALPKPTRFIYISSTSVYGQVGGEEVDETSPTEPLDDNGRIVLAAEQLLRAKMPDAVVLRFAGIYGPSRIIRRAAIERGEPLIGDADKWLNLIHVDDAARAVLAAEERGRFGETYLIADDEPVRRREFFTFMAELLKAPMPRFEPLPQDESANRRAVNRKMREELGVALQFPDYRSGLLVRRSAAT